MPLEASYARCGDGSMPHKRTSCSRGSSLSFRAINELTTALDRISASQNTASDTRVYTDSTQYCAQQRMDSNVGVHYGHEREGGGRAVGAASWANTGFGIPALFAVSLANSERGGLRTFPSWPCSLLISQNERNHRAGLIVCLYRSSMSSRERDRLNRPTARGDVSGDRPGDRGDVCGDLGAGTSASLTSCPPPSALKERHDVH